MTSPWDALLRKPVSRVCDTDPHARVHRIAAGERPRKTPAPRAKRKVDVEVEKKVLLPLTRKAIKQTEPKKPRPPNLRRELAKPAPAGTDPNPWKLSPRQLAILDLLVQGMKPGAIALRLALSTKTISCHLTMLKRKMGVPTSAMAVLAWHRHFRVLLPDPASVNRDSTLIANLAKLTADKSWSEQ